MLSSWASKPQPLTPTPVVTLASFYPSAPSSVSPGRALLLRRIPVEEALVLVRRDDGVARPARDEVRGVVLGGIEVHARRAADVGAMAADAGADHGDVQVRDGLEVAHADGAWIVG